MPVLGTTHPNMAPLHILTNVRESDPKTGELADTNLRKQPSRTLFAPNAHPDLINFATIWEHGTLVACPHWR